MAVPPLTRLLKAATLVSSAALLALLAGGCPERNGNEEILVTISDVGGGQAHPAASESELLLRARTEGEVNWYTSIPESEAQTYAAAFSRQYPGVRVQVVREGTFDLIGRLESEISAGRVRADVLHVLDPAIFIALRQRGELLYYEPPEATAIPPAYKDIGYWTGARVVIIGLACRAQSNSSATMPETWSELLAPRWKGKLGLKDAQTSGSAYAQYYLLREKYGAAYWEQMADQRPRIYKTEEALLEAVVRGEIQVAAGVMSYKIDEYSRQSGGAVQAVWPRDGVPTLIGPVAILSRSPHPNAARLFTNYMLSEAGQELLGGLLKAYPTRSDVAAPEGLISLQELRLLRPPTGWKEYLEKQGALRAEYNRLLHGETE